jgi:8-oxo-dGTP pyrophosphatase MutT (NUDIX family)
MIFSHIFKYCPVCGSNDFYANSEKSCHCSNCDFEYFINASAAVGVFIVNDKNELLVCVRGKNPEKGKWDLPGGFVDYNESAENAVIREIKEELGVDITDCNYLFSFPNRYEYSGLTIPTLDLFFECKVSSIDSISPADDVADCLFTPLHSIDISQFGFESMRNATKKFIEFHV